MKWTTETCLYGWTLHKAQLGGYPLLVTVKGNRIDWEVGNLDCGMAFGSANTVDSAKSRAADAARRMGITHGLVSGASLLNLSVAIIGLLVLAATVYAGVRWLLPWIDGGMVLR